MVQYCLQQNFVCKMSRTPLFPTPRNPYTMPPPLMPHYPPIHAYSPPPRPHHMRAQSNSNQSQRTTDSQPTQNNPTAAIPKPKRQDSLKITTKQIDNNGTTQMPTLSSKHSAN